MLSRGLQVVNLSTVGELVRALPEKSSGPVPILARESEGLTSRQRQKTSFWPLVRPCAAFPRRTYRFTMFAPRFQLGCAIPANGMLASNAHRLPIVWAKLFPFVRNVVTWRATMFLGTRAQVVETLGVYRSNNLGPF